MDEEIRKLYEARMTISDIARKVGIPRTTVNYRLKKMGVYQRKYAEDVTEYVLVDPETLEIVKTISNKELKEKLGIGIKGEIGETTMIDGLFITEK